MMQGVEWSRLTRRKITIKANYTLEKALMDHLMNRNIKDPIWGCGKRRSSL